MKINKSRRMEGSRSRELKCLKGESEFTLPIRKGYAQYSRGKVTKVDSVKGHKPMIHLNISIIKANRLFFNITLFKIN